MEDDVESILHCKKSDKNGWYKIDKDKSKTWDEEKLKIFWKKINTIIDGASKVFNEYKEEFYETKQEYNYEPLTYEFAKVIFPELIENYAKTFYGFDKYLSVYFKNCRFLGKVDFRLLHNAKSISFEDCLFYEDVEFINQKYQNNFIFENCSVCKNIKFQNIVFGGLASFIKTTFCEEVTLIHTRFDGLALFNDLKIELLTFDNTFFRDEANFLNMKNSDSQDLKALNLSNRETARIIKNSFEKQNNIIEANKFYALEMEKREEELNLSKNTLDWFVFKTHKISSNHSQDWFLVLLWILNTSIVYTHWQFLDLDINNEYHLLSFYLNILSVLLMGISYSQSERTIWTITSYFIYAFLNNDFSLCFVVNNLNPFSIMIGSDTLNLWAFLYKVIIAYLTYQFIISIRQNTRRK